MRKAGYRRLTDQERFYIKTRLDEGASLRLIARELHRSVGTISREVVRNSLASGEYCPDAAERKARRRRKSQAPRSVMTDEMRDLVADDLRRGLSPEQISGVLRKEGYAGVPCPNTLYKYIRAGDVVADWKGLLRHRGRHRKKGADYQYPGKIPDRVGLSERPREVDARVRVGDFEVDLIVGARNKGYVLTAVDLRTGKLFAAVLPNKKARTVCRALLKLLRPYTGWIRTLTFDNGREFAWHKRIAKALGCVTFFTEPYHAWEKGAIENLNGLIRQYLPKWVRLDRVKQSELDAIVDEINNRPRKRLGWDTPEQAFEAETGCPGQMEIWYNPQQAGVALGIAI